MGVTFCGRQDSVGAQLCLWIVSVDVPEPVWPLHMPAHSCAFHLFMSVRMCIWGVWTEV